MTSILEVGGPLPAAMGRCADLYHDIREMRLAMEKQVEAIKARETEVQEHIIANLSAGADTGAAGLRYRAQVVVKPKPRIADWGILTAWVRKNDRFDMLQHRLSDNAALEWMENEGRQLPGTETIQTKTLSVTKI